jgi:hypothetical protein
MCCKFGHYASACDFFDNAPKNRFDFWQLCVTFKVSSTNVKEVIQCQERYWSEVSEQLGRTPAKAALGG